MITLLVITLLASVLTIAFFIKNNRMKVSTGFFLLTLFAASTFFKVYCPTHELLTIYGSNSVIADEGYKTYSARNRILFGKNSWSSHDNYRGWHKNAIIPDNVFFYVFKYFGISRLNLRYLMISISSCIFLFLFSSLSILRKDEVEILLFSLFFLHSNILTFYGRMAYLEQFALLFFTAGFFLYCHLSKKISKTKLFSYIAAILSFYILAALSKINIAFSLAGLIFGIFNIYLDYLLKNKDLSGKLLIVQYFLLALTILLLITVAPLRTMLVRSRPFDSLTGLLSMFTSGLIFNYRFVNMNPFVLGFALLMGFEHIYNFIKNKTQPLCTESAEVWMD